MTTAVVPRPPPSSDAAPLWPVGSESVATTSDVDVVVVDGCVEVGDRRSVMV
jgi:hypothetical protein